jgi:hypothetical protein
VGVPSASVLSLKLNDEHTAADKLRDGAGGAAMITFVYAFCSDCTLVRSK